jgi:hypothetical protein
MRYDHPVGDRKLRERHVATETDAATAARLAALRNDPAVVIHRPKVRTPFQPTIHVEGPIDLRVLLGRDDEDDTTVEPPDER